MIDYKLIADNDPTGTLDSAFASMSAETITTNPEKLVTYISVANQVGFAESGELEAGVLSDTTLPKWVDKSLNTGGVNVNDPQVAGLLSVLVSAATSTKILAMGDVLSPKYPNLTMGVLADARRLRTEGVI